MRKDSTTPAERQESFFVGDKVVGRWALVQSERDLPRTAVPHRHSAEEDRTKW